jgi:dihydrolipoamide dehydrogenase
MEHDAVIIGGGPAGVEAAVFAAQNRLNVALITDTPLGGRAVWGSLVPSKVWLSEAYKATCAGPNIFDIERMRDRIAAQSQQSAQIIKDRLTHAGVTVYTGKAVLDASLAVTIAPLIDGQDATFLNAGHIIIATGSEPIFSPTLQPAPPRIIAPRLAGAMPDLPESLIMAGGGVTGVEYASAFAALGVKVTMLQKGRRLLRQFDPEVVAEFEHWLTNDLGITIHTNAPIQEMKVDGSMVVASTEKGEQYMATHGFIAAGRRPDLSFFKPDALELVTTSDGALLIDPFCQTSLPGVYAIGDAAGAPMTVNHAQMQARVAISHILFGNNSQMLRQPLIEAVYTYLPIAQIGNMDVRDDAFFVVKSFDDLLKARIEKTRAGIFKVKINRANGLIEGAAAFGPAAVEVLNLIQIAIHQQISWDALRAIPLPHPTYGEILTNL